MRIVGLSDDVFFVMELDDNTDGSENLLPDNLHVGLGVGEDGGLDKVTLIPEPGSSKVDGRALLLARVDVSHDTLQNEIRS